MNPVRLFLLGLVLALPTLAESPQGYYRYPALHGDTLVFTAEGDLWKVSAKGGVAQRLTTHPGMEAFAAISPDGQTVAFSAEYEGPTEIYTMPLAGGVPTRLTYDGSGTRVAGWTPAGEVLYATLSFSTLPNWQLVTINPKSAARQVLPLAQANQGVFAPDGKRLFFTRLPKQGSSTKRYQGGTAENLWSFGEGDAEARPLTADFKGTSRNPMWWQGRLYFASDRDGIMNLWSMKPDGSELKQHTKHLDHDVKTPTLDAGRIVYQFGADLRMFEIATSKDSLLEIRLASDFDQLREKWVKRPLEYLTAANLSPTGDRLALTARGQVFVAPVETGRFVEIPRASGVRYRNARFMPDGKMLLAQTDESGEVEFCQLPANGVGAVKTLTTNGTVFRFSGTPSPDGRRIAWSDKDRKFWVHEIATGQTTLVMDAPRDEITDFAWSPDSRWIALVHPASNTVTQILLYDLTTRALTPITSDRVESYSPAWSPDGKWLYFLSDRELRSLVSSPWGPRQPDPFFTETTKLYALALTKEARWPFQPKDELQSDKAEEKKEDGEKSRSPDSEAPKNGKKAEAKVKESAKPVAIELDGLSSRLFEVPAPAGNYSGLEVTSKHLLWRANETGFAGRTHLKQLEITNKEPKAKTLVEDITSFQLSGDGKKILVRKGESFHVIAADSVAPAKLDEKVNLEGWVLSLTPREEWRQVYTESWRMMRDYFYDRNMHGVDWRAMHTKYLPLVDRVSDRTELSDVISEMVGELAALHIAVRFGDKRDGPDQIRTASLGALMTRDVAAKGWRVERIYRTDADYPTQLAPLQQPGVGIAAGDVVTAINGRSTADRTSLESLLRNQAGKQVLLEVKPRGSNTNRQVIVKPISSEREADLRYDDWELTRRELAEKLGAGQIGYVHLRAMSTADIAQWARGFFPVFNRQGLIIDVRHNNGGNIDSWILSKLLRKAWFYWQPRTGEPYWNMHYAFRGHMVVLCDERTASDGEAFSEGFKRLGLGKVIGTRTWGGEVWLSAQRWLVDSGMASAAETGVYGPEGEWLIEGHGVDPDIVVDNLPHETFKGRDAQLEAAVKHLKELIAKDPRPIPAKPSYPNKALQR